MFSVVIRRPVSALALPLVTDLGPGETEMLMLALESREAVVVLDDALARQVAEILDPRYCSGLVRVAAQRSRGIVLMIFARKKPAEHLLG